MLKFISAAFAAIFFSGCATPLHANERTGQPRGLTQRIEGVVDGSILSKAEELMQVSSRGELTKVVLLINSPGGDVLAGSIYISALEVAKTRGAKVECYVPLLAASMAFQILAHCDTRFALDGALFLWHPPRVVLSDTLLTPYNATVLANELNAISQRMSAELLRYLAINKKKFWYHFHAETLHTTSELQALSPGWIQSVADIPGIRTLDPSSSTAEGMAVSPYEPWRITYIWDGYSQ